MHLTYLADQPDYADAVADGTWQLWGRLISADGMDRASFGQAVRVRAVKDKVPFTLIAIDGGQLAGAISVKQHESGTMEGVSPWIGGLFVHEAWRGQGLGKALLQKAEHAAAGLGVEVLYLSCEAHNEAFYTALGWTVLDRVISAGDEVAVMRKQLMAVQPCTIEA